jgi:hypothetical protein
MALMIYHASTHRSDTHNTTHSLSRRLVRINDECRHCPITHHHHHHHPLWRAGVMNRWLGDWFRIGERESSPCGPAVARAGEALVVADVVSALRVAPSARMVFGLSAAGFSSFLSLPLTVNSACVLSYLIGSGEWVGSAVGTLSAPIAVYSFGALKNTTSDTSVAQIAPITRQIVARTSTRAVQMLSTHRMIVYPCVVGGGGGGGGIGGGVGQGMTLWRSENSYLQSSPAPFSMHAFCARPASACTWKVG